MGQSEFAWALADPGSAPAQADARLRWADGRIVALESAPGAVPGPRRLVLPALANAHDHARTFRSATLGAWGHPLESWLPYLGVLPALDPYASAATSFARSLRHGVVDLMVHYTRVQGGLPYIEEAEAVGRAARDVGVRIGFAVAMRDRQGIAYAPDDAVLARLPAGMRGPVRTRLAAPALDVASQLARVDEVAAACEAPHMRVQYGPTGVQWCSQALLEGIARACAEHGRPVHMHLLETRYQREWADVAYPQGVVRHLDALGLLTPRLTLAHCTWCRPDELALLAERGVTIAVNTSSNLALRSGVAPVQAMLAAGCRVAMGLDGLAFDEDDDALREMRLAYALHQGTGFDAAMSPAQAWAFAARHGRRAVRGVDDGGGVLAPGAPADFLVLDWDALDDDALWPDIEPWHLLLARGHAGYVREVVAAGRAVMRDGRVVGVDETSLRAELLAQARSLLASDGQAGAWRSTLDALAGELAGLYRGGMHCGCC
ncbi:amidohydrolase family protein [Verticiella sediminum]|uniref:amidohydrolase family protein n=1 Tax=Verticiella sediminum TaxID=1247510 RepID=UPI001FE6F8E4|nr:amidohydrolase family protein [Verticiella sediminum]